MDADYHVHTSYSDGSSLATMVEAAADAGLSALGCTDHCILWADEFGRAERFDFDETYPDRRADIEALQVEKTLHIYDAVEVSYEPGREAEIESFLSGAGFDYAIGSVHFTTGYDVSAGGAVGSLDEVTRRAVVDDYVDRVVSLIDSELFEVAAHLDLTQRVPALRGTFERRHYERLAVAFESSRTRPELNLGRVDRTYGRPHPDPDALDAFTDRGIAFVPGTDAHRPSDLRRRVEWFDAWPEAASVAFASPLGD